MLYSPSSLSRFLLLLALGTVLRAEDAPAKTEEKFDAAGLEFY